MYLGLEPLLLAPLFPSHYYPLDSYTLLLPWVPGAAPGLAPRPAPGLALFPGIALAGAYMPA